MEECNEMSAGFKIVLVYYLAVNAILFAAMGIDKARAKKDRFRISESALFVISLLGGGIGGLCAMRIFRHKTRKMYFYFVYIISAVLHAALLYLIFTKLMI